MLRQYASTPLVSLGLAMLSNAGASSVSNRLREGTLPRSLHTAVRPYIADVATYGNTHALATYRQAGCQDGSYSTDHKMDIYTFSWIIKYQVFNPFSVGGTDTLPSGNAENVGPT